MDLAIVLPVELVQRIVRLVAVASAPVADERSVTAVAEARTTVYCPLSYLNSRWEAIIRPILYHSPSIWNKAQSIAFVRTLRGSAERAVPVQELVLCQGGMTEESNGWSKEASETALTVCTGLRVLGVHTAWGKSSQWPFAMRLLQERTSLTSLTISEFELPVFAELPQLRSLTLREAPPPEDAVAFARALSSVVDLSVSVCDALVDNAVTTRAFLIAMAPQLHTLRLWNGSFGVPLDLVQQIIHLGHSLKSLHSTRIGAFPESSPFDPPSPTPSGLPALDLHFIIARRSSRGDEHVYERPVEERLWAKFQNWGEPALDVISAMRSVRLVVLEPWMLERFGEAEAWARDQMKRKGCELKFRRSD